MLEQQSSTAASANPTISRSRNHVSRSHSSSGL
jgi:hypothetical protein